MNAVLANTASASALVFSATQALESTKEFSALKAAKEQLDEAEKYELAVRAAIGDKMEQDGLETLEVGGVKFGLSYSRGSFKIKDEKKFMEKYPQFVKTKTTTEPSVIDAKKAMEAGFIFEPEIASLIQKREIKIVDEK